MKKNYYCILILVIIGIMVGLTESSLATTIITFSGLVAAPIPPHYAEEANINIEYNAVSGIGSTEVVESLDLWGATSYGDLSYVAYAGKLAATGQIIFTPSPGYSVTINSLDVGFLTSIPPQQVVIYDLNQTTTPLWSSGPLDYTSTHLTLSPNLTYSGAIRLQFGTDWNFGIDNISYTVVGSAVIPEPATMLLLGTGLLGLTLFRRKAKK